VAAVGLSTTLARSVTGGVVRRPVHSMPGSAACITPMAVWAGTAAVRGEGSLFVASGINLLL